MMNPDPLNLYQLRILAVVVEHGSFRKAARALNLTQPAVSAQIRHLKTFANGEVFARDGRKVVLTEQGRALYRYAQEMLGAAEVLRRDLIEIGSGERDRLMIGGSLAYATYVLPSVLAEFQRSHPEVWVSVIDQRSNELIEQVRTGVLDLGVVTASRVPTQLVDQLVVGSLGNDDIVLIEGPTAPFSQGSELPLRHLANVPFVRIALRQSLAETLSPLLSRAGLEPTHSVMEVGTWEGVKEVVRLGYGAAVVFRSVVQRELDRGDLRVMNVPDFAQSRETALICSPQRRKERMTAVFASLIEHITRVGRSAGPAGVSSRLRVHQ